MGEKRSGFSSEGLSSEGLSSEGRPKYIFTTFHVQNYEHKYYQVGGDNLVIIALGFSSTMTIISAIVQTNAVDSEDR